MNIGDSSDFYRDETLGVLLSATKNSNDWPYAVVDGDKTGKCKTTCKEVFSDPLDFNCRGL